MKNRIIVLGMVLASGGGALGACGDSTSHGPLPPAAPTNLAATTTAPSEITLTWQDNSDNEASFELERCTGVGCTTFTQVATLPPNTTGYQDQGLSAGASYSYRVCAHNAGGDSYYSNTAAAMAGMTPPAAPSNVVATALSPSAIALSWQDNSDNEETFYVEQCIGTGCTAFMLLVPLPANMTSYQNVALLGGTSYSFRVRACGPGGCSIYSNTATATTGVTGAPPAAPTNLVARGLKKCPPDATPPRCTPTVSYIELTWQDNSDNEAAFVIERCTGVGCTDFTYLAYVYANRTTYQNGGRASGTTYSYRVRANNAGGYSSYSNTATATLP